MHMAAGINGRQWPLQRCCQHSLSLTVAPIAMVPGRTQSILQHIQPFSLLALSL